MAVVKFPGKRSATRPGDFFSAPRIRECLRFAFDVLVVYPAVVLAVLLAWGGGFSFDGMARSYVSEMATYAGRPATATELTAMVCTDEQPVSHPPKSVLAAACRHWEPQLVSKEVISQKLAIGARVTYWFLVLTALAVRLGLSWGGDFASGRRSPGGPNREGQSPVSNHPPVNKVM